MQLKTNEEWANDFDGIFSQFFINTNEYHVGMDEAIKKFIANLLTQDRQDTITAVIEMVEGVKKDYIDAATKEAELDKKLAGTVTYNDVYYARKSSIKGMSSDIITKLQALSPKE
jgi:hypothetical protein